MNKKNIKDYLNEFYKAMMAGISYMVPVIVAGGILQALPNLWTGGAAASAVEGTIAYVMYTWGSSLFGMMYYILAIYTSFAIAGRPGIVAGLMAALVAVNGSSGFLGALVGGIVAGYVVKGIMNISLPDVLNSARPILIIPLVSSLVMMFLMVYVIEPSCGWIMTLVYNLVAQVQNLGLEWLLFGVFGICVCFGMGGPLIAATVPMMLALIADGNLGVAAAMNCTSCASCYGTALAVLIFKKKYRPEQRGSVAGLLTGGLCQITEFQIPFWMDDLKVMTPCYILAGFLGGALVSILGDATPTFHGGIFTAFLASNVLIHFLCIIAQALFTCAWIGIFKKNLPAEENGLEETASK